MSNRSLSFYKIESGYYQVSTFAGSLLGAVRLLTGPQGRCWRAVTPAGSHLPIDFTSRQDAGEALFQEAENRSRAARDADLGRTGPPPASGPRSSGPDEGESIMDNPSDGFDSNKPTVATEASLGRAWTFYVDVQDNEENCLVVTAEADGEARGEFTFRWVDLEGQPCPCPRLEAYQDGWAALHVSGLLWAMARWPEDISMTDLVGILLRRGLVIRRGIPAHG